MRESLRQNLVNRRSFGAHSALTRNALPQPRVPWSRCQPPERRRKVAAAGSEGEAELVRRGLLPQRGAEAGKLDESPKLFVGGGPALMIAQAPRRANVIDAG